MELKEKLISSFMAFEERIDVHAELHDVRTAAKKTLKIKVSQPKKLGNTPR
jgi:Fe-S cluster assembly protein SufD